METRAMTRTMIVSILAALRGFSRRQRASAFLREYQPPWFPHASILHGFADKPEVIFFERSSGS